jgi:hypothetical protein
VQLLYILGLHTPGIAQATTIPQRLFSFTKEKLYEGRKGGRKEGRGELPMSVAESIK